MKRTQTYFLFTAVALIALLGVLTDEASAAPVIRNVYFEDSVFVNTQNTIRVNITDSAANITTVLLSVTNPESNNFNMQKEASGFYEYTFTPGMADTYTFYIWGINDNGESITSSVYNFLSLDDSPVIEDIIDIPDPVVVAAQNINFYVDVSDPDENLDTVWVQIREPASEKQNITLTNISNTFVGSFVPSEIGTYKYAVWASDDKGNIVFSKKCSITACFIKEYEFVSQNPTPFIRNLSSDNDYFYVRLPISYPEPTVKLSANITDNYGTIDRAGIRIYYPNGELAVEQVLTSLTEIYEYTYAPQEDGAYIYEFFAEDASGTVASAQSTFNSVVSRPMFNGITIAPAHQAIPIGDKVRIAANVSDPHNDVDKVFLHISYPAYKDVEMTNIGGGRYEVNYTVEDYEIHYIYIWANDSRNNRGRTNGMIFSDDQHSEDLNVSVETLPKCCAKFDYLGLESDTNYTIFDTYNPYINYMELDLRKAVSMLSNCGNQEINVTNNCLTLRKEVIEPDQENITITGDNTTHVVAYCCWNEDHLMSAHSIPYGYGSFAPGYGAFGGPTYFCEWNKDVIPMPPYELNTFEDFFMYFSYAVLYEGWYNVTASAYYERYNQSDCDIYGYNDERCQCEDTAYMTIRFLKEETEGVTPHLIPQPIPVPVSDQFVPKPDIVIVREMPEYIDQLNGTCNPDDTWNTCTYAKIKLVLYNRGTATAYNITLNDTAIVSNEDYSNFCPWGIDECNPAGYACMNSSSYECITYNDTGKLSAIYFDIEEDLEPREYAIVEYLFAPNDNYRAYNTTRRVYYDFSAQAEYIYWTQVNNYDVFITLNSSEDSPVYNPDESDYMYLENRPGFSYDLDTNIHSIEETRNMPVDTYTIFNMDINANVGEEEITNPWEAKINLDESWTVGGCAQDTAADYECEYSNSEHWVRFMKSDGIMNDKDSIRVQFMAKTSRIADFLLDTASSDDRRMDEDYMPGMFVVSNPIETVNEREPSLAIVREMVPQIFQKEGCNESDPADNCTYTKIRLIVYNRGAETATNVRIRDTLELGDCGLGNESECYPLELRCISGMEAHVQQLNITNTTYNYTTNITGNITNVTVNITNITEIPYTDTRPYSCFSDLDMDNGSYVDFNITYDIYPFDYRVVEYEIVPTGNLSAYTGGNYYMFDATADYMNENNKTMPSTFENDARYNPPGSKSMYLENRTAFEFDVEIERLSVNDTLDRDFAYGVYTIFNVKLKAMTGDVVVEAPWYTEFSLPYSWEVSECGSTEVICYFNSSMHWLRINGSSNLRDGNEIEFWVNASAREMKDFLVSSYSDDNRSEKNMDESFIPGLWTISRLTHFVNVTILEPYPNPVPEPEPTPRPEPIPEEVPNPDKENKLVLTIKPLNWSLETYQGSGIPVTFEIENIGNETIYDLEIDAIHFEGWEYESAKVAKIDPGEKLYRTIFIKPAEDAQPGYYIIAVKGFLEDGLVLDIGYFQLHVLEGEMPARMEIIEFSDELELEGGIEAFVPVLVKNTGTVALHNVTAILENMDDCIESFEPFREDIEVNETKAMYFKVRTKDTPDTCRGSLILMSDEGAYGFSGFELTIEAPAPQMQKDYMTLIILGLYALIMTIYAIYRRKHHGDDEEEENKELTAEEKKKKIIEYLMKIGGVAILVYGAYYLVSII